MLLGAYPRVCGATQPAVIILDEAWGLSPRVRGNHFAALTAITYFGPIPACAGQPESWTFLLLRFGAYPRVCGATSCT